MPKFGDVSRRVAAFGAEARAEGVNLPERHRGDFPFELTGNAQTRFLPEKVVGVILFFALRFGVPRSGRNAEHFAGAFAVAGGNDRRVNVNVTAALEELVNRRRQDGADAENGVEGVRAQTQVRNRPQIFERMSFLLKRIFGRAFADQLDRLGVHLDGAVARRNDLPDDAERGAEFQKRRRIRDFLFVDNDLQVFERRSVVEFDERHRFRIPRSARPTANGRGRVHKRRVVHHVENIGVFHLFPRPPDSPRTAAVERKTSVNRDSLKTTIIATFLN